MKKILVNVNEENLEKLRAIWLGIRGYRLSNSDIVNQLVVSELLRLQECHDVLPFQISKNGVPSCRKSVRTLDEAIKEKRK